MDGRIQIVKAALDLRHYRAAEESMTPSVDTFYGDPLPLPQPPSGAPARSDVAT